jgi:hypothetical protein
MFSCSSMRAAVLLSALLLGLGVLFGVVTMSTALLAPTSQLALALVLAGAAVLAVVFVDALLPGADQRLDGCRH